MLIIISAVAAVDMRYAALILWLRDALTSAICRERDAAAIFFTLSPLFATC